MRATEKRVKKRILKDKMIFSRTTTTTDLMMVMRKDSYDYGKDVPVSIYSYTRCMRSREFVWPA